MAEQGYAARSGGVAGALSNLGGGAVGTAGAGAGSSSSSSAAALARLGASMPGAPGGLDAADRGGPLVIVDMRELRSKLPSLLDSSGLRIEAVTLEVAPSWRATRAVTLRPALEGRVYLQDGLRGESVALVGGVRWRTARRTFVEAGVGPLVYSDDAGTLWRPVLRARAQREWRVAALEATVSHDLTVPAGRGGVLAGQLAEVVGRIGPRDWELRARGGAYRSHPDPRDERWVPGWGYEASAFRRLLPALWLGVSALRFERLASSVEPAVSRDSVWLRLEMGARP
jgi:hypothetical protein